MEEGDGDVCVGCVPLGVVVDGLGVGMGRGMIAWELGVAGTFILVKSFASSILLSSVSYVPGHPILTRCAWIMHVIILVAVSVVMLEVVMGGMEVVTEL